MKAARGREIDAVLVARFDRFARRRTTLIVGGDGCKFCRSAGFSKDSHLVVCVLDNHYREKIWPTFARECFPPRVPDGEVIPIFLDDTPFVGIPKDIIGIKVKRSGNAEDETDRVTYEIVFKLMERLG